MPFDVNTAARRARLGCMIGALCAALPGSLRAGDLVYHPANPAFGGSPLNSAHLLGVANAQNDYSAPSAARPAALSAAVAAANTPAAQFARQLQSRLLSALATRVTESIMGNDGTNGQDEGHAEYGDQVIDWKFNAETGNIDLTITDASTNTKTKISVPKPPPAPPSLTAGGAAAGQNKSAEATLMAAPPIQ